MTESGASSVRWPVPWTPEGNAWAVLLWVLVIAGGTVGLCWWLA